MKTSEHKAPAEYIASLPARSAWKRGVKQYALEMLEELEARNPEAFEAWMMNDDASKDARDFFIS